MEKIQILHTPEGLHSSTKSREKNDEQHLPCCPTGAVPSIRVKEKVQLSSVPQPPPGNSPCRGTQSAAGGQGAPHLPLKPKPWEIQDVCDRDSRAPLSKDGDRGQGSCWKEVEQEWILFLASQELASHTDYTCRLTYSHTITGTLTVIYTLAN